MTKQALIVDDSKVTRQAVKFALEADGFSVHNAENGEEGLKVLNDLYNENKRVDIILADMNMPVMNGMEFVAKAKADPRFASIPILMLTTESRIDRINEGRRIGIAAWLVKPFQREYLLTMIHKYLKDAL